MHGRETDKARVAQDDQRCQEAPPATRISMFDPSINSIDRKFDTRKQHIERNPRRRLPHTTVDGPGGRRSDIPAKVAVNGRVTSPIGEGMGECHGNSHSIKRVC